MSGISVFFAIATLMYFMFYGALSFSMGNAHIAVIDKCIPPAEDRVECNKVRQRSQKINQVGQNLIEAFN